MTGQSPTKAIAAVSHRQGPNADYIEQWQACFADIPCSANSALVAKSGAWLRAFASAPDQSTRPADA